MSAPLTIVHVASEMTPLAKVGGLGDVVGALSAEQARRGHDVIVALPAYRALALPKGWTRRTIDGCDLPWGLGREAAGFDVATPPGGDTAGSLRILLVDHLG